MVALGLPLLMASFAVTRAQIQPQTQVQPPAPTMPTASLASPLAAQSLDRLSATRERPLFSPSRRPPAPPPVPIVSRPPPPAPPKVTLFGIILDADEARAVVSVETADKIRRVRIGDDIQGWKVTQIEERWLVLSLDDRSATFKLFGGQDADLGKRQPLIAPVQRKRD